MRWSNLAARLAACQKAISTIEYAMLLALVSAALLAAVLGLGGEVLQHYDSGSQALRAAGGG